MTSGSVSHKITFSGTVFLAHSRGDLLTQVRMIERYFAERVVGLVPQGLRCSKAVSASFTHYLFLRPVDIPWQQADRLEGR